MPVNISAPPLGVRARGGRRGRVRATSTSSKRRAAPMRSRARRTRSRARRRCRAAAARRTRRAAARGRRRATAPSSVAAALDERLEHAFAAEQRERRVEVDADAVGGRRDDLDLGAGRAPRVDRAAARASSVVTTSVGRERRGRRAARRRGRGRARRAARAAAACAGSDRDVAHGERGPVGERGAGADDDRLRVGAQLVRVGARRVGRDPLRRCRRRRRRGRRGSIATLATTNGRPVRR